jgi:hypothetical protein
MLTVPAGTPAALVSLTEKLVSEQVCASDCVICVVCGAVSVVVVY